MPGTRFIHRIARSIRIDRSARTVPGSFALVEKDNSQMVVRDGGEGHVVGFGFGKRVRWGLVLLLAVVGCKHEPPVAPREEVVDNGGGGIVDPDPCDPNTVYFQQQVLPILISNCAVPGCHNTATDDNDEIEITSFATLMESEIVEDGDLWEVINEDDEDDIMPQPPQNPLTQEQIDIIGQWIQQGAQNNSCENACDTSNVTYTGTIRPLVQQRCQGCHSGGSPQGGLNFTVWGTLNMVATDGRLAGAIQHQPTFTAMPPSGPMLPDCRIEQFLVWIDQGAPNN